MKWQNGIALGCLLAVVAPSGAEAARLRLQGQIQAGVASASQEDTTNDLESSSAFGLQLAALVEVSQGVSLGLLYGYMASGPHEDESALDVEVDFTHSLLGPVFRGDFGDATVQATLGWVDGNVETRLGPFAGEFDDKGFGLSLFLAYRIGLTPATSVEIGPYLNALRIRTDDDRDTENVADADYINAGLGIQFSFATPM